MNQLCDDIISNIVVQVYKDKDVYKEYFWGQYIAKQFSLFEKQLLSLNKQFYRISNSKFIKSYFITYSDLCDRIEYDNYDDLNFHVLSEKFNHYKLLHGACLYGKLKLVQLLVEIIGN